MNLVQMRTSIRNRLGVPAGDSFFTDTVLTDFVNEAIQAIQTERDWPWLQVATTFNTVSGTATYTPPADWSRTKALGIDGRDALEWRSLQEMREYPATSLGPPALYNIFAEQILLRPAPDGVYTVLHDYIKGEPFLVQDTDTPVLPAQYHYAAIALGTALAHARNNEIGSYRGIITGNAAAALQLYTQWLTRMKDNDRRTSSPMRVRVRPGGGYV